MKWLRNRRINKLKCDIAEYEAKALVAEETARGCTRVSYYHDNWMKYRGLVARRKQTLKMLQQESG